MEQPNGIRAIQDAFNRIYTNQSNALQIKSVKRFRDGGPDPLDYIFVYLNEEASIRHYHYVTCGLSDIYDEFPRMQNEDKPSGFGFELTIRIKIPQHEVVDNPPKWPAILLQSLARYVYRSQTSLLPGDHVPWDKPLDSFDEIGRNPSKLRHMILTKDPKIDQISTQNGHVSFVQIFGVTNSELKIVQSKNVQFLLDMIRNRVEFGGEYLVTDIQRTQSVRVKQSLSETRMPSSLSGVTVTGMEWNVLDTVAGLMNKLNGEEFSTHLRNIDIKNNSQSGDTSDDNVDVVSVSACYESFNNNNKKENSSSTSTTVTPRESSSNTPCTPLEKLSILSPGDQMNSHPVVPLTGKFLELVLPLSAGKILPVAITNRIMLGSHFTFLHAQNPDRAITLVPANTRGAFVSEECPFACRGNWLQVFISGDFAEQLDFQFSCSNLNSINNPLHLPLVFRWPERHMRLVLVSNQTSCISSDNICHKVSQFTPIPTPEMLQKLLAKK